MLLLSAVVSYFLQAALSHRRVAQAQLEMTKALFVAEGGLQRGVSYVAQGGEVPASFSGTLADGVYAVTIIQGASLYEGRSTIVGALRFGSQLNPGVGEPYFRVTLPDGTTISEEDIHRGDFLGYHGSAHIVRVKPIAGRHNTMMVNDEPYPVELGSIYGIYSDMMTINIYNDRIRNGKAMGHWWVALSAAYCVIIPEDRDDSG